MKLSSLFPRLLLACVVIMLCAAPAPARAQTSPLEIQRKAPTWPPRPDPVLPGSESVPQQSQGAGSCSFTGGEYIRIVFMSYRDVKWEIYRQDACGAYAQPAQRLTNNSAFDGYPRVDHALSRIVFVSDRDGSDDLYSMDMAGGDVQRLTDSPGVDTYPAWSPDGQQMVFVSDRDGDPDLHQMDRDGSNARLLFHLDGLDSDPSWSPDGKHITWVHWNSDTTGQIMTLDLSSGVSIPLTGDLAAPSRPARSSDGRYLAFSADMNSDGWLELAWMSLPGGMPQWRACYDDNLRCDFQMGSLWPDGFYALVSRVSYVMNGTTLYVRDSAIYWFNLLSSDYWYQQIDWPLDFAPDAASSDTTPPVSRVLPLPEYSPASGFSVRVVANDTGAGGLENVYVDAAPTDSGSGFNFGYANIQGEPAYAEVTIGPQSRTPGEMLYFRSRAMDAAGHYEPNHPSADTFTHIYGSAALGQVADQREHPLDNVRANLTPAAMNQPVSDSTGALNAYFTADGAYDAALTRPGYLGLPPLHFQAQQGKDIRFTSILPAGSNLLQNGQFEDPAGALAGWEQMEVLPISPGQGHTGTSGAGLGLECAMMACFSPEEPLAGTSAAISKVTVTPDGQVHLVYNGSDSLYYTFRSAAGQWSAPVILVADPDRANMNYLKFSDLVVDGAGDLAFVYKLTGSPLTLMRKPNGAAWESEVLTADAPNYFVLRSDLQGSLHLLFTDPVRRLYYTTRRLDATWTNPQLINDGKFPIHFDLLPVEDGTVHMAYFAYSGNTFEYVQRKPDGELSVPEKINTLSYYLGDHGSPFTLFSGKGEKLHVVVDAGSTSYFYREDPTGWTKPVTLYSAVPGYIAYDYLGAGIDDIGNLQIFFRDPRSTSQIFYALLMPVGKEVFEAHPLLTGGPYYYSYHPTFAPDGTLHLLTFGNGTTYRRQQIAPENQSGSLRQTVNIPANLYKPTLSFFYQIEQYLPSGQSGLEVELTPQEGSPVRLLTLRGPGGWQHAWADLSPWQGQAVTLTFRLNQSSGETPARITLDEVAVSAWASLFIHSVEVTAQQPILDWQSVLVKVTVRGENYAESVRVVLGGREIPCTRLSESELTFTIPADFLPGSHALVLENPGGVQAIASNPIHLGLQLFLPLVRN